MANISETKVDLPEPLTPVIVTQRESGISTLIFFKLCSLASIILRNFFDLLLGFLFKNTFSFPFKKLAVGVFEDLSFLISPSKITLPPSSPAPPRVNCSLIPMAQL